MGANGDSRNGRWFLLPGRPMAVQPYSMLCPAISRRQALLNHSRLEMYGINDGVGLVVRVRSTFRPSSNRLLHWIKAAWLDEINRCNGSIVPHSSGDRTGQQGSNRGGNQCLDQA